MALLRSGFIKIILTVRPLLENFYPNRIRAVGKGQLEQSSSWKVLGWNIQNELGMKEIGKF